MVPGKVDTEIKEASKILLGSNEQKSPEMTQPGTVKITPMDPSLVGKVPLWRPLWIMVESPAAAVCQEDPFKFDQ